MEENLHCLRKGTRLIGRYTIEGVLGQGGFGITYLGIDELHEKQVAIKEFFPQGIVTRNIEYEDTVTVTFVGEKENYDKGKERFLKEARTMAKFSKDKGIVKALDFFEINNTAYIVMEYLEGITLKQYLRENQRIAAEDLVELLVPLIEALDEIHSQGLIHRDISPDNIMVLPDGRIKLMDFGAARDYTEFGEKSLSIVLKPGYAPPEQYQTHGVQGPWTDIYALCATMYKCITGENPPDAIERVMDDHLKKISAFGIPVSPQIEEAIIKGISVAAKDRYQNMGDFCGDLYGEYRENAYLARQEYILQNPRIQYDTSEQIVTWDCLWFGIYPQTQITENDGAIYTILKNEEGWDAHNDIIINNIKYHKKEEIYFKYEPIKWRILQRDSERIFVMADIILDIQPYDRNMKKVSWEKSYIRNWLNTSFIERAFTEQEQQAIAVTKRGKLPEYTYNMTEKYTLDKVFLLSQDELSKTAKAQVYGFTKSVSSYDEARKSKSSQYAEDVRWWWIEPSDKENGVRVSADGWLSKNGYYILKNNAGVRPAMCLNLSSAHFSYAGTVASDGTEDEVDYTAENVFILK